MRSTVRSMSAGFSVAFRMWLSHLDNCLSCGSSARASAQHGRSVQDVSFASGCQRPARLAVGHAALRAGGMPVQSDRRAGGVADQRSGAHEHGRHGRLLAARGCAMFARMQIGMVSQAELVLRLGRTMSIRFREAMGVLSSGMSSDWTLASLASSTLADAINTIESSFIDAIRSQCHGLTSLHANHHARSTCA